MQAALSTSAVRAPAGVAASGPRGVGARRANLTSRRSVQAAFWGRKKTEPAPAGVREFGRAPLRSPTGQVTCHKPCASPCVAPPHAHCAGGHRAVEAAPAVERARGVGALLASRPREILLRCPPGRPPTKLITAPAFQLIPSAAKTNGKVEQPAAAAPVAAAAEAAAEQQTAAVAAPANAIEANGKMIIIEQVGCS